MTFASVCRSAKATLSSIVSVRAIRKEGASELLDLKKAQWYMDRCLKGSTALRLPRRYRQDFAALVGYFLRCEGVLGKAAEEWADDPWRDDPGAFWGYLDLAIGLRIRELKEETNDK